MKTFVEYISEVNINNVKGRGAVPNNQDVDYFGLRVQMTPKTFLDLAAKTSNLPSQEMIDYIKNGGSIGAPFLDIIVPDNMNDPPHVVGHEGRNRMMAVEMVEGNKPIEVHIFPRGAINRAKHINKDVIRYFNKGMYKENTSKFIRGPLWK